MKQVQGTFITGYVTVVVKGNMPELFFQKCVQKGIVVWNVRKADDGSCLGNVKLQDIRVIRKLRHGGNYKLSFINKKGTPFLVKRFVGKKELVTGFLISILLIFFLSNVIWDVKITGVPNDLKIKIEKQLDLYGVHSGAWGLTLDSPSVIQQKLVDDIPELLWVGVNKKGTTYFLEGVEKSIVKEKKVKGPRNLIASKKGVIKNMYVSKGLPKVSVNDYVKKGDILVSGELNFKEDNTGSDEKKEDHISYIPAEGNVIAETWYKVSVTIPLIKEYELLTGNHKNKYFLKFGDTGVPIWGFGNPDYKHMYKDTSATPIHFLKWDLPIQYGKTTVNEKTLHKEKRSEKEAVQAGKVQAKNELLQKLGTDAKVISQKVLHESMDNGKVNLILYITAEENIAKEVPIQKKDSTE